MIDFNRLRCYLLSVSLCDFFFSSQIHNYGTITLCTSWRNFIRLWKMWPDQFHELTPLWNVSKSAGNGRRFRGVKAIPRKRVLFEEFHITLFILRDLLKHKILIASHVKWKFQLFQLGVSMWKWVLTTELEGNTDNTTWNKPYNWGSCSFLKENYDFSSQ